MEFRRQPSLRANKNIQVNNNNNNNNGANQLADAVAGGGEGGGRPRTPQGVKVVALLWIFQAIMIVLFSAFVRYAKVETTSLGDQQLGRYAFYQDVHVMVFIGFGFLMTFQMRYGFSAVGFNFALAAFCIEWSLLALGFFKLVGEHYVHHKEWDYIRLDIVALVDADFCAASILIAYGAVLGKTTFLQLLVLAFFHVIFYSINFMLGVFFFQIADIGGSMIIHMLGAYYGLTIAWMIGPKLTNPLTGRIQNAELNSSIYHSDIFSMIGTLFLWMFWPSFNAALASYGTLQQYAIVNTLVAIATSCISAFSFSIFTRHGKKLDMVDIQNATLAGGVAIGTIANVPVGPGSAMVVGAVAGLVSVCGFRYLTPFLEKTIQLHDSCGVHNLHGMPSIISALAGIVAAAVASEGTYEFNPGLLWPGMAPSDDAEAALLGAIPGKDRTAAMQAGYQAAFMVCTISVGICGGLIVGWILRNMANVEYFFSDEDMWNVPVFDPPPLPSAVAAAELERLRKEQVIMNNAGDFDHYGSSSASTAFDASDAETKKIIEIEMSKVDTN